MKKTFFSLLFLVCLTGCESKAESEFIQFLNEKSEDTDIVFSAILGLSDEVEANPNLIRDEEIQKTISELRYKVYEVKESIDEYDVPRDSNKDLNDALYFLMKASIELEIVAEGLEDFFIRNTSTNAEELNNSMNAVIFNMNQANQIFRD